MATLKTILDEVSHAAGFTPAPQYVNGPNDDAKQLVAVANRAATYLSSLIGWSELRTRTTETLTSATEYDLPSDFRMIDPDTFWSVSQNRKVDFPTDREYWAFLKSHSGSTGIRYRARLGGGQLEIHNPTSGDVIAYDYISNHPVLDADATTTKERFDSDTDTFRLSDEMLILESAWRYRRLKQLEYADLKRDAQAYTNMAIVQSRGAQTVTGTFDEARPPYEPYTDLWVN